MLSERLISGNKKVLVAPLDWGLGHATRCIPVIRKLLSEGHEVCIASDNAPKRLLEEEFGNIRFIRLRSYGIQYQKRIPFLLQVLLSVPRIFYSMCHEHFWLAKLLRNEKFDVVVSDSRFGLWNNKINSVFITHQISIQLPFYLNFINWINTLIIRRYQECWVPDEAGKNNLSGALSHGEWLPKNLRYIGIVSRFDNLHQSSVEKKYDLLVMLSGPEPQRSIFEQVVLQQLMGNTKNVLILRGKPGEGSDSLHVPFGVEILPHLKTAELQQAILASDLVLCRSGYSSIMDLAVLGKKAVFVPTPGQTEQEYIAKRLEEVGIAYFEAQNDFMLQRCMLHSARYSGFSRLSSFEI